MNRKRSKEIKANICIERPIEKANIKPTNRQVASFSSCVSPNIHSPVAAVMTVNGIKNTDAKRFAKIKLVKKIIEGCFRDLGWHNVNKRINEFVTRAKIISTPTAIARAGP